MDRHELNRMFDALTPALGREEELLDGLLRDSRRRKNPVKNWKRIAIGLAAAVLLVGTAAAAHYAGISIVDSREETGDIWLAGGIAYYPVDELSEEAKALAPKDALSAGKVFESWQELEDFLGIDLMNNPLLDKSPAKRYSIMHTFQDGRSVKGRFVLMTDSELTSFEANGCYEIGELDINVDAYLYTDKMEQLGTFTENFIGYVFSDDTQVSWEGYTTAGGVEAQVMEIQRPEGVRNSAVGAVSFNGIPVVVRVHTEGNTQEARQVLLQILDSFQ